MNHDEIDTSWYIKAFGEIYPLIYAHRTEDAASREINQLEGLLGFNHKVSRILDVGCGTGRHSVALIRAGQFVIGLDFSATLLSKANEHQDLSGHLVRGDMRFLPMGEEFDTVISMFTSFGYFIDDRENWTALSEMCRVLRSGGHLVIDHINRLYLERNLVESDSMRGNGFQMKQRRRIRGNRIEKDISIVWDDGEVDEIAETVRLIEPHEFAFHLRKFDMRNIRIYGDFDGKPLTKDSKRMILMAEKSALRTDRRVR